MTVPSIATIAVGLSRALSSNNSSRSSSALNNLLGVSSKSNNDIAQFSNAALMQNQLAQFRVASNHIAHANGALSAADAGASEIARGLVNLRDLAMRASDSSLSADVRAQLNLEFQSIRQRLDRIARTTRFSNEVLLDGTSAQLKVPADTVGTQDLSVGSFTDATLYKGTNPDISTASGAKVAEATIKAAQDYVQAQRDVIGALQDAVDLASTAVETAFQNQESSRSELNEGDLLNQLLGINNDETTPGLGFLAAGNHKTPGNLLKLLGE